VVKKGCRGVQLRRSGRDKGEEKKINSIRDLRGRKSKTSGLPRIEKVLHSAYISSEKSGTRKGGEGQNRVIHGCAFLGVRGGKMN